MMTGASLAAEAVASAVMCIMIDGMDQAKFAIPRDPRFVKTKTSESLIRPHMHVAGTLIHGFGLLVTIADPDIPKDSNHNQECIGRALNTVFEQVGSLPLFLHVQADNTSREGLGAVHRPT